MCEVKPNYFTCTLGEAVFLRKHGNASAQPFQTVLDLIKCRARDNPNSAALGFANPREKLRTKGFITFAELYELSRIAASVLKQTLSKSDDDGHSSTVGLFCHSSLDLVLSWLGLLQLRRTAFFLAPQLEAYAVEHLCQETGIREVLVDDAHRSQLSQIGGDIKINAIPSYHGERALATDIPEENAGPASASSVVFLQHTSGTSSGLPKPIVETEWGAVGCLPVSIDRNPVATFTTTPFYHGGVADSLRAWTSGAMIWFFPEGAMPITGDNIILAVNDARKRSKEACVKYFSSVPYVLQMLLEVEGGAGIELLKSMSLVGVGGAPLPPAIGDSLVQSGVKLLSRMGSVECGFLMSSHRKYSEDKQWEYLRVMDDSSLLEFEPRGDGSYATADLFEPHPQTPNAWRYHGRADALITLANGKKFDPQPIEDSLKSSNKIIQDVLVFGAGQNYPGALLFTSLNDCSDDECLERIWPDIEKTNSESPYHARLSRISLAIVRVNEGEAPIPKSTKGTVLRSQAKGQWAEMIHQVYTSPRNASNTASVPDDDLVQYLADLFREVLGRQIDPAEDIYSQGVDSIACVQITKQIQAGLVPAKGESLPQNIVYNNGTILALANTLKRIRHGDSSSVDGGEEELALMRRLVEKYTIFGASEVKRSLRRDTVVVLTGATGGLGAHILHELINDSRVTKIYCLLRGQSQFAAKQRISKALIKRKLRTEEELESSGAFVNRITCLRCDLGASDLGLSDNDRSCIINGATHIIHAAWTVNFTLGLTSFETQIANTRDLVGIAHASGADFFFISSTAAVCAAASKTVPERVSSEPGDASALGYSRSKWVAEQICVAAHARECKDGLTGSSTEPKVSIIRVGQLCGNEFGVWNTSEAYPLLLSTAKLTACLPDLPGETLDWLPVDTAATAVIEIALPREDSVATPQSNYTDTPVYHVLNPNQSPSWRQMLEWLPREPEGHSLEIVSASEWMKRLEAALTGDPASKHPSQALVGMWKQRYGLEGDVDNTESSVRQPAFEVESTQRVSQSIRELQPLDRHQVVRMWEWIRENC
ncbi:hypothetical protein F5B22DRAFT_654905 [Xylaria bambusicola]|uniref:uncharacterized protein n=1 Tax=Xylaria bambusicola TaxID=326684 RepID=UPI002008590A|nr:uncharacterized protein F5B22DRAFT_654905 [Xylaria bambusicola]KAI0517245.1 hypothetical protein F5B22DRAFT_654905 [Xylaria bambusicola]